MEKKTHITSVYTKFINRTNTPEELDALIRYFGLSSEEELRELINSGLDLPNDFSLGTPAEQKALNRIDKQVYDSITDLPESLNKGIFRRLAPYRSIAAAVLLICGIGAYFLIDHYKQGNSSMKLSELIEDAEPGGNRATLTLADGRTIDLSDKHDGIIIDDQNIKYGDGSFVIQSDSEESLSVRQEDQNGSTSAQTLVLTTPKGGQYQVTLPDCTRVWLNAASTLKYPARFTGVERRVELSGEAYFEVAKQSSVISSQLSANGNQQLAISKKGLKANNSKPIAKPSNLKPFIVTSNGQEVTVLGTHFNITAYADEKETKTTLIEGAVQVATVSSARHPDPSRHSDAGGIFTLRGRSETTSTILSPNQQSILTNGKLTTKTVNTEDFIAWKDNLFIFHNSDLKSIMLQLSRWYDFNIDINTIPDVHFYGEIPKDVQLSEVLKMLAESSNLSFKLVKEGPNKTERRMIIDK